MLDKITPNGQIEWAEWLQNFNAQFTDAERKDRTYKEKLSGAKAYWSEAARSNPGSLNIDEFLAFTHPEFSQPLMLQEVDLLMSMFDSNRDDLISTEEMNKDEQFFPVQDEDIPMLDSNSDGQLSKRELLKLFDSRGKFWAHRQANALIDELDDNEDDYIQCTELDLNSVLFPDKFFHPLL